MSVKFVDLAPQNYAVQTANEEIVISVSIGDAADESSSYSIFLGRKFIAANKEALLGNKMAVQGQQSTITASITDVLEETNQTSVTIKINEGNLNPVQLGPYTEEVAEHLDTIVYTLQIKFI